MKLRRILLVAIMTIVPSVSILAVGSKVETEYLKHENCSHEIEVETKTEESITCYLEEKNMTKECPIPGPAKHNFNQLRYKGPRRDTIAHEGIEADCTITSLHEVYTMECSCGDNDGTTYYFYVGEHHSGC